MMNNTNNELSHIIEYKNVIDGVVICTWFTKKSIKFWRFINHILLFGKMFLS